ncbi:hypothetical protein FACS189451_08150 [Bacteroidia bacterium]|nr:hypothetical protein FACS189446_5100 [Bacteroidia bacterium]GHT62832.1 hypothetical protein FACS189451_08150 [Bacteroidia bacterium]
MKKEINKNKKFDIASFEMLESNGSIMLKGGFSSVYDEKFAFGGKTAPIVVNNVAGCGCTIHTNNVAGCACK